MLRSALYEWNIYYFIAFGQPPSSNSSKSRRQHHGDCPTSDFRTCHQLQRPPTPAAPLGSPQDTCAAPGQWQSQSRRRSRSQRLATFEFWIWILTLDYQRRSQFAASCNCVQTRRHDGAIGKENFAKSGKNKSTLVQRKLFGHLAVKVAKRKFTLVYFTIRTSVCSSVNVKLSVEYEKRLRSCFVNSTICVARQREFLRVE